MPNNNWVGKMRATGTLSPFLVSTQVSHDPTRGLIVRPRYRCVGDNMGGIANVYYAARVGYEWEKSAHKSEFTATISGGQAGLPDDAKDNWQLMANEIHKDLFTSKICSDGIAGDAKFASKVEGAFAAYKENDFDGANEIRDSVDSSVLSEFDTMIFLLGKHVDSFYVGQYVLRHSINISNFYTASLPGDGSVEHVWAPGDLLSAFAIPAYLSQKISSIPEPDFQARTLWGWRQLPSTASTAAQNRVDVSTEWWLDLWSTDLYAQA